MKQKGFILITILILLAVLAMLSLNALTASLLQLRMSNNAQAQLQEFQAVETGLQQGETQLLSLSDDALPKEYVREQYKAVTVHYIIARLPGGVCIQNNGKIEQGHRYRITAWSVMPDQQPLILQTTYAKALAKICTTNTKSIKSGRLSWRQW